jgi:hypothetical protein
MKLKKYFQIYCETTIDMGENLPSINVMIPIGEHDKYSGSSYKTKEQANAHHVFETKELAEDALLGYFKFLKEYGEMWEIANMMYCKFEIREIYESEY